MIVVQNVSKYYGDILANDTINLMVNDGQIALLLGPNGAGKSTLLKCIAGLLQYDGKIIVNELDNKSLEAKKIIGYVSEVPAVYDLLTIGEHLEFIARAYRLKNYNDEIYELLYRFELMDHRNKLGKDLSKGMQQKVNICCALLPNPKILILDEPMIGLDPHSIKELKEICQERKRKGASILISTHMLDSVEACWDIAHIMVDGRILASKLNASTKEKTLEQLFFEITEGGANQL